MPAVTPTLIMGVLGIVLSAPAWVLFIRAARRLYLFIAAGQPAPGRTNRPVRRGVQVLKEVFFHTELIRRPAIAVAHWFVMVGFLIGSLVWFEAYIQTFNPALPHWVAGVVRSLYPNVQPGRRVAAAVPVVAVSFRRGGPGDRHRPGHWVPLCHSLVDGHAGAVIPLLRIERAFGFLCGRRDLPGGRRHAPGEGREDRHLWSCLAVGGLLHPILGQVPPRQPHNCKCLCPV